MSVGLSYFYIVLVSCTKFRISEMDESKITQYANSF